MLAVLKRWSTPVFLTAALLTVGVSVPAMANDNSTQSTDPITQAGPATPQWSTNGQIFFQGPIPIGGWYSLTMNPDGHWNYSGNWKNTGYVPWSVSSVCVVRNTQGTAWVFQARANISGRSLFGGAVNRGWNRSGFNGVLKRDYRYAWTARCQTQANLDVAGLTGSLIKTVGYVKEIYTFVA